MSAASIDEVVALYERWATDKYDEEITQLEHAEQTAALAVADGSSEELIAAALLHDVGHLLELQQIEDAPRAFQTRTDLHHEAIGARYLAGLFPPSVTAPIALHVRAKRYRCAVDPAYADGLSSGSAASLVVQGGPLTADEVAAFEQLPGHADAVVLRGWDDGGKIDGIEVPPFESYRPLLERLALV